MYPPPPPPRRTALYVAVRDALVQRRLDLEPTVGGKAPYLQSFADHPDTFRCGRCHAVSYRAPVVGVCVGPIIERHKDGCAFKQEVL